MEAAQTEAVPRKLSLMELVEQYQQIYADADAGGGEITEEIGARFDAVNADIALKAEAIAYVVRDRRAKAAASKALGKPYVDRGAMLERQADALEDRLFAAMKEMGKKRIETPTVTLRIQASSPAVKIIGDVPAEYLKPAEPDKTKIKAAIDAGVALAFAEITRGEHLRMA